jgi:glycosyltransferase involved in cell wall biosynthesis
VVISDRGSLPEVAGAAAVGVAPEDAEGLSQQMERLLDPEAARDATAKGFEQASRYSWEQTARSALEAYRAALAHRASRRA